MKYLTFFTILLLTLSCGQTTKDLKIAEASLATESADMKPGLIHTVYFWTKEGTAEGQFEAFEKGLVKLGTCPQIQSYFWGPPAPTEARGVVDNSYSYAINVHFATVADEEGYQNEPIHLEFIENHKDIWAKVVVYDNVVK